MASNTQKSQKRNRIEMIGSAAANTFTNAAAVALFANPALAINPANVPVPEPSINTHKLISNHTPHFLAQNQNTSEIFHPHNSHVVVKQGDNLGNDIIIHDLKYYTIDRNGDVYFMGHSQDGKLLIGKNKELLWHEGQNVGGLVTDAIEAEGMFHGSTFDLILSGKPTDPPHSPEAVVIMRNGGIIFDSRNLGGNFLGQYSHKIGTDYFYEYSVNGKTEYLKNGEETVSQLPQTPNNKPAPKPNIEPNELSQLPVRNAMGFQFNNHNTYAVFTGTDASGKWNLVVAEGGVAVAQACCPTQDKADGKAASTQCEPGTSPEQCNKKITLNQKIVDSINKLKGLSTKNIPGTDGGKLGCLAAVNEVLKNAGIKPLGKLSVLDAKAALDNGRGTPIDASDAKQGDIVLVDIDDKHHIGFCFNDGCSETISNSTSKQTFSWMSNINFSRYKESPYKGSIPYIYRLNP